MSRIPNRIVWCVGASVLAAMVGLARPCRAADEPVPGASPAPPATQQAAADPFALINQLGDDDFHVRDAAAQQLRKMDHAALAALTKGAASSDPEIRTRCQGMIKELDEKDHPKPPPTDDAAIYRNGAVNGQVRVFVNGGVMVAGPGGQANTTIRVNGPQGAVQDSVVAENGVVYTFHSDAEGVVVVVTTKTDSKAYRAKDIEDLKKNQPEGYKVYLERFAAQKVDGAIMGGGGVIMGGVTVKALPPAPATAPATQP